MLEPSCAALDFLPFEGLAKTFHSKKTLADCFIDCSSGTYNSCPFRFDMITLIKIHTD